MTESAVPACCNDKLHAEEIAHNQTIDERNKAFAEIKRLRSALDTMPAVIGEADRLRRVMSAERRARRQLIASITELTVSTDGDPLGHDEEIPVGEIVRVLAESESVETSAPAHKTTVKQNPPDATSASIGTPVGYAWECVCGASQTYDLADGRWGYPLSEDTARRLGSQHVTDARR